MKRKEVVLLYELRILGAILEGANVIGVPKKAKSRKQGGREI